MTKRTPAPLKRRKHVAEPERRFYIFCEGTKTEPKYLEAVDHQFKHAWINVTGVGGVPRTVVGQAIEHAKELRSKRGLGRSNASSYEKEDQVWVVLDRDNHPEFNNAVDMCRPHHVQVARSNPCFELWLVLHLEDFDKPTNSSDIQARLHQLFPDYHHQQSPSPNFEPLLATVLEAERRATMQLRARETEQQRFGNPSTTVGCLTRTIRDAHERTGRRVVKTQVP